MKEFWVKFTDKNRFIDSIRGHHLWEISDPRFTVTQRHNGIPLTITKHYHYRVDITEEEYLFLKLQFDLKEEL